MIRRASFFLLLALAVTRPLCAQLYLGVEGGWNTNHLTTGNSSQSFADYKDRSGFSAGIPVLYRIHDWLALQADPSYIQKNYRIERTGFFNGVYQNNTNAYWQLPVMVQFSFGSKDLRGFVNFGGYAAYWASGRINGSEPAALNPVDTAYRTVNPVSIYGEDNPYSYDQKYAFDTRRDNRLEWGLLAGVGVSYELNGTWLFFVEHRYTKSLTDQQKAYQLNETPRYNDTFGLSAGCLVRLDHFTGHSGAGHSRTGHSNKKH